MSLQLPTKTVSNLPTSTLSFPTGTAEPTPTNGVYPFDAVVLNVYPNGKSFVPQPFNVPVCDGSIKYDIFDEKIEGKICVAANKDAVAKYLPQAIVCGKGLLFNKDNTTTTVNKCLGYYQPYPSFGKEALGPNGFNPFTEAPVVYLQAGNMILLYDGIFSLPPSSTYPATPFPTPSSTPSLQPIDRRSFTTASKQQPNGAKILGSSVGSVLVGALMFSTFF
ncbi:hypothetical protein HDU97_005297 [Phlyctochytrium planicorne]|nr:hypothetical protein HDU97_005297 [Phlyctochytrium planicorne]